MHLLALWLLLAVFWSGSYVAVKIGLDSFGPMTIVAQRMVIGACLLYFVLKLRSETLRTDRSALVAYGVSALFGNVFPFLLIGYGELYVESGLAALLMGIAPVATVFLAPMILPNEFLTPRAVLGILFGVAGLVALVGVSALSGIGGHFAGQIAILGAALCYTGTTLYVRRYVTVPPLQMATGSLVLGAMAACSGAFLFEAPFSGEMPTAAPVLAMLYLGVCSTAIATLIYFHLVPLLGAGRMQQINFLVPALGTFFGVALLGEPLKASSVIALGLISVAVYLVSTANRRMHVVISPRVRPS
ncbi:DMT family transporter [Nisaea acidiphila]|uniref:DMT family transporter n=1 Tax=Nisaea acidiphila TaxID=1862145 RepID=A0A9J7ARY1_9PROT|nr:DMT family transporter [Nisaea acidiphila]UUX50112.1 DMT family transporter [Nisaea acidiphila]